MVEGGIGAILGEFVEGFNTNSLDDVMTFFADDAVYEPGDGRTHRGRAAIRAAFRPQFENAFGTMRFLVNDQVVDERARKATIRWVCQHDFATMKPPEALAVQGDVRSPRGLVWDRHLPLRRTRQDHRKVQLRELRQPSSGAPRSRVRAAPWLKRSSDDGSMKW
jgi:hypothetical protein